MTTQTTITKPAGGTRPAMYRIGTCAKSATTYGSEGEIVEAGSYAEAIAIAESRWPLDPDGDLAVFAAQAPDAQPVQAATHTPGPWYVGGGPRRKAHQMRDDIEFIGIGNGACHLGNVAVTPAVSEAEAAANARLIASAPALLAALDHALAALEHEHPDCIGDDGYSASIDDGPEMDVDLAMIRKALQLARGTK